MPAIIRFFVFAGDLQTGKIVESDVWDTAEDGDLVREAHDRLIESLGAELCIAEVYDGRRVTKQQAFEDFRSRIPGKRSDDQ